MRILYLIPSLGYNGASRQLELLARSLDHRQVQLQVCQLAADSAASARLHDAGIPLHSLAWTRPFDVLPLLRLRGLLHDWQPDLIHAWHPMSLRVLGLVGRKFLSRVVLSQPLQWRHGCKLSYLDRWLLARVARIVVQGEIEAQLGQQLGLYLDKIAVIPPGIAASDLAQDSGGQTPVGRIANSSHGKSYHIVCIGPLEGHKGYRDALWSFDMLHYAFPKLRLTFVGDGPERPALQRFTQCVRRTDDVYFAGHVVDVSAYLNQADICWVPSRRGGGTIATLEAMHAGLPIVASQVPNLHGLIVDGQSGFVTPPGNNFALSQRTRQIFLDPALAASLGAAARRRACQHFPVKLLLHRCLRMYQEVAA